MARIIKIFFIFIPIFTSCHLHTYQLHFGASFFQKARNFESNDNSLFSKLKQDTSIAVTGIYSESELFLDEYPVIRIFDQNQGPFSLPITKKLPCPEGALIKVVGQLVKVSQKFSSINQVKYYQCLAVASFEQIRDTRDLQETATQVYQKIRRNLQKQITPDESKLTLQENPTWRIWYDPSNEIFIFSSHQYDLMYAANIEFIVNAKSGNIMDIYAKEWFKGEL